MLSPLPRREEETPYTIVGIDVHKKLLVVVVADVTAETWEFEGKRFGATTADVERLRE